MKFYTLFFLGIASVIPVIGFSQNSNKNEILVFFSDGIAHKTQTHNGRKTESIQFTKEKLEKSIHEMGIADSLLSVAMPGFSKADTLMMLKNGEKIKMPDFSKLYKIRNSDKQNVKELLTKLNSMPEVLYAELNAIDTIYNFIAQADPPYTTDPQYKYQWGLNNFNRYADIDAEKAWEIFKGNPNSIIAIIDQDGIDKNHYDLKNKIAGGDNSFSGTHGTEMAGVAAAETNNGSGMAGVDWYARIHPQKITSEPSVIAPAIVDAVKYDKNVHVLNCSWGIRLNSITARIAFAYAYKANRTCVAAIGNKDNKTDPDIVYYPAGYPNVIAVGATDEIDKIWEKSERGNHVDVCAPGVGIKTFDIEYHNGTSYSAAFVSGLASLLKGYNNDLANDDIENIIKLGADPQEDPGTGYGRINAKNSLDYLRPPYTLYQWSTTGGTVYQTSGLAYGTFMGVEGLMDGKYWARRFEVRKTVTFSERFTEITGAWGRGAFTKGFNNENPNLGVGYCAIVPETLNENGCTLTTYVYEVKTNTGVKYFPRAPSNVIYAYSVLGVSQKVTGPETICSSGATYTVENVPAGQTVIWNYSSNLRQSSIGTNTITLMPISNGSGWISATIGNITTSQKPLNVGIPSTPTSITNFCCNGMGFKTETAYVFSTSMPGATQYDWIVSGGVILYGQGTNSITVLTSQAPGSGISFDVSVRAVNNCGWSTYLQRGGFVAPNWGTALFSVYPNPTSSEVTISVLDINSLSNSDSNNEKISISNIEIIDHFGNIRKKVKKGTKQEAVTINISDLSKGIYLIKIGYGLKEESHKLLIE